ncbi:uncharacterized protein PRCAT00000801001 [Priceomyces carsonii]|uniref:uncharacterized protein n=1 Tax=Priceomyces carsonii TaxID=28549 RepID=UPI002ED83ED4|nr:unnamed protein product [Priceomyces carsonii]
MRDTINYESQNGHLLADDDASESSRCKQPKLYQKIQVLDYHRYQSDLNSKHTQADTVSYYKKRNEFTISRSAFSRWVLGEKKLREDYQNLGIRNVSRLRQVLNDVRGKYEEFARDNDAIFRCLKEHFSQTLLVQPQQKISVNDVVEMFAAFAKKFIEDRGRGPQVVANCSSNIHGSGDDGFAILFLKSIDPHMCGLRESLDEWKRISNVRGSLIGEKERIMRELNFSLFNNVYIFQELIIDLDNLFDLIDIEDKEVQEDYELKNAEQDILTGDLRTHRTVSFSLCGNLNGSDFLSPMIISNLESISSIERGTNISLCYHPEGIMSRAIFQNYMEQLNVRFLSDDKHVKIILDNYRPHLGCLQTYSNIEFILINPNFDKTVSSFNHTSLTMPYEPGLERLIKLQLKLHLFKFFHKHKALFSDRKELFDSIGWNSLQNMKYHYENIVKKLISDKKYNYFYYLNILASRLFNVTADNLNIPLEDKAKFNMVKGLKFSTFITEKIPAEYKNAIKFNDKMSQLSMAEEDLSLKAFVAEISMQSYKNNRSNLAAVKKCFLDELFKGRNETKLNKQYSIDGIYELVRHEINNLVKLPKKEYPSDYEVDQMLLKVQPYIINYNEAVLGSNPRKRISGNTLALFNKFYDSYIKDTALVHSENATFEYATENPQFVKPKVALINLSSASKDSMNTSKAKKRRLIATYKSSFSDDETDTSLGEALTS